MGGSFFCDAQPLLSADDMLGCAPRPGDEAHEAARVHHPSRRRSSHLAAHGARAAGRADAAHRRAAAHGRGRCGISDPHVGVPGGIAATGLDRRPQCSHRHTLGRWRMRTEFPDGQVVLLTRLREGQRATILQLPVAARPEATKEPVRSEVRERWHLA
jgi:hypothetical protein